MRHLQFLGSWVPVVVGSKEGESRHWRPDILDAWHSADVQVFRDMGQVNAPTEPNVCVFEAVVTDEAAALLEADPTNYTILLDELVDEKLAAAKKDEREDTPKESKPRDEKPDTASKTSLEAFLKGKGVQDADAAALSKKTNGNVTRHEIARDVIAYCNALPRARTLGK